MKSHELKKTHHLKEAHDFFHTVSFSQIILICIANDAFKCRSNWFVECRSTDYTVAAVLTLMMGCGYRGWLANPSVGYACSCLRPFSF